MADFKDQNTYGNTSHPSGSILELTTRMTEALNRTQTSTITSEPSAALIGIKLDGSTMLSGPRLLRYISLAKTS